MPSFEPIDSFDRDLDAAPPRPTTPPVRRGFVVVFLILGALATLVYGIPFLAGRVGYAYEAGRAKAALEAIDRLDQRGVLQQTSTFFRLASTATAPAVVHISVYRNLPDEVRAGVPAALIGSRPGLVRTGTGSGVVMDKGNGYIVTNNHVIEGAEELGVRFGRSDEVPAQVVGADPKTDLAVIRVPGPLRAEARWGDSNALDVGDWVLAIGSPFELDQTITAGIVSATGRDNLRVVGFDSYEDFIQTDAAINPGNSGGPLVNLKGEVVGINAAILAERGGSQGLGLAISSALAKRVVESLIREGRVPRGYLGVSIDDLSGEQAREMKLPSKAGVLVREIEPGSPAEHAGLMRGDVVVRLDNAAVEDVNSLRQRTAGLAIGSEVRLDYFRNGELAETKVRIDPLPIRVQLGLMVQELGPPATESLPDRPEKALFTARITPGSAADRAGLVPGLRVVGVGDRPTRTREELDAALAMAEFRKGIPLKVQGRDGQILTITLGGLPPAPRR
ncbi:MAG: trypsin-like peptidase domain-containing protein [Isosphaeraceae bacterium]